MQHKPPPFVVFPPSGDYVDSPERRATKGDPMEEQEQIMMVVKQLADQVLLMAIAIEKLQNRIKKLEFEKTDSVSNRWVSDMNQKYDG
jgi:hypothetical protein